MVFINYVNIILWKTKTGADEIFDGEPSPPLPIHSRSVANQSSPEEKANSFIAQIPSQLQGSFLAANAQSNSNENLPNMEEQSGREKEREEEKTVGDAYAFERFNEQHVPQLRTARGVKILETRTVGRKEVESYVVPWTVVENPQALKFEHFPKILKACRLKYGKYAKGAVLLDLKGEFRDPEKWQTFREIVPKIIAKAPGAGNSGTPGEWKEFNATCHWEFQRLSKNLWASIDDGITRSRKQCRGFRSFAEGGFNPATMVFKIEEVWPPTKVGSLFEDKEDFLRKQAKRKKSKESPRYGIIKDPNWTLMKPQCPLVDKKSMGPSNGLGHIDFMEETSGSSSGSWCYLSPSANGSRFPFHAEDANLHSASYMVATEKEGCKLWRVVNGEDYGRANNVLKNSPVVKKHHTDLWKTEHDCQMQYEHRTLFPKTEYLLRRGFDVGHVDQRAGCLVITMVGAMHSGENYGETVAEAQNFFFKDLECDKDQVLADIELIREACELKKINKRPPVDDQYSKLGCPAIRKLPDGFRLTTTEIASLRKNNSRRITSKSQTSPGGLSDVEHDVWERLENQMPLDVDDSATE